MADKLEPGDLVLRDGRVEEVFRVNHSSMGPTYYEPVGAKFTQGLILLSAATRVGNVRDGWRKLDEGQQRPTEACEWFLLPKKGVSNKPYIQGQRGWFWRELTDDAKTRVVAYRVISRAQPEGVCVNGVLVTELSDREAELRAVAAERPLIQAGDIVLLTDKRTNGLSSAPRDLVGKAHIAEFRHEAVDTCDLVVDGVWLDRSRFVRIGSPRDGWCIHTGSERPADVGADDWVEWWTVRGKAQAPGHPVWSTALAYRVVSRAERITGQGENCGQATPEQVFGWENVAEREDGTSVRAAELRAVATEMRAGNWGLASRQTVLSWADRIDPPKPEPLKVGDRCRV